MTELGTKFPALGGVDRLRLVERAWGQGYRWWVKAARALEAQAVATYDRKHVQPNKPALASVGETNLGQEQLQEQEERETARRKLTQRVVSPVIQVTDTGEITVAGIKKGKKNHRRQPRRATGTDGESIHTLQNVYGDHAMVSELRHVSTVCSSACLLALTETLRLGGNVGPAECADCATSDRASQDVCAIAQAVWCALATYTTFCIVFHASRHHC